jgi:hypothetical protein
MKEFYRLIIPEKAEAFLVFIIGAVVLILLNIKRFWLILDGNPATVVASQEGYDNFFTKFTAMLDSHINPNWLDLVMWLLIGCLGFLIFSIITASFKSAEQEVELLHYFKNPNGRNHEIIAFVSKAVVRITAILGGIIWLVAFINVIMPFCTKVLFTSVTSLSDPESWLWMILSVVIFAISIYLFEVIVRLIALRTRIF